MHGERDKVRRHQRDWREILERVVRQFLLRQRQHHHIATLPAADGVTVRGRARDHLQPQRAARAHAIINRQRLAELFRNLLPDQPRQRVARIARRGRHDHADGFVRIRLRDN